MSEAASFVDLGVHPEIVAALRRHQITAPFAIQELTLPIALKGQDLIGQARTGMGKTLGFGIPLLHRIATGEVRTPDGTPRALVVVPTRELCLQVTEDLRQAAADITVPDSTNQPDSNAAANAGGTRPLSVIAIYGGTAYTGQRSALAAGADVVVGTPGRLLDLADQGELTLGNVEILVLDEADQMLDLGFLPAIERLLSTVPEQRQTMLFSATMPNPILTLARTFLNKPLHVRAESNASAATHERTAQFVYRAHVLDKVEMIARILQARDRGATMIFARTKRGAQKVADELQDKGFRATAIHGDLNQQTRERALKRFREGRVDVLVATDVAARGIDIDDVTHVINYQCPDDEKTYVHRIGRTGRAGRTGIAITLVDWDDLFKWSFINKALDLGKDDPVETYSTSQHLYQDLDIPEDAGGSIRSPRNQHAETAGSQPTADRGSNADEGERTKKSSRGARRQRRRTRGGRTVATSSGNPGTGDGAAQDSDSTTTNESQRTADAKRVSDEDATTNPRRRRRRRRNPANNSGAGSQQREADPHKRRETKPTKAAAPSQDQ